MNKKLINIVSKILIVVSFIFIAVKLKNFNINLKEYINLENLIMISLSIILLMISVIFLGIGWTKILKQICNVDIEYKAMMPVYIKTNLAKYVPGNIMQFVGRNIIGSKYNIEQKKLALSTVYELIILSTIGMSIILLTNQVQKIMNFIPLQYILIIIIGFAILLIFCIILIKTRNIVINKTKVLEILSIFKVSIISYLIALVLMGLSFVIIMMTVYEYDKNIIIIINWIGVFILSWFVGFITPGAPGGIGIREAILIAYMSKLIPSEYILEAVLIHRIVSVISDSILYILHILFYRKVKKMSSIQPQGNYYDKYGSNNKIVIKLMNNFFSSLDECLKSIEFSNAVEAGCGEGKVTNYIHENYKCKIEGFDIGEEAIKKAKEEFSNIEFDVKSIYDLPYKDNQFDLVVCCEVLEHLHNYDKALEELIRISSRYILVSVPCEPIWRILNLCRLKYISDFGNTPGHVNHWSKKSFIQLLNKYGDIKIIKSPLPWTMILLEKRI